MTAAPDKRRSWWKRQLVDFGWLIGAIVALGFSGIFEDTAWWERIGLVLAVYCIARMAVNDRLEG